jgi:hypothetical protein
MLRQGFFGALVSAVALPLLAVPSSRADDIYVVTTTANCVQPPSGLGAWYPGDGNANDIQGTNNGTLAGSGTTFPVGEVGQAFSFSGSGYVSVNNSSSLNPTAAMTVDAWVKTTNSSVEGSLMSKFQHSNGAASDDSYYLGINGVGSPGTLRWQLDTPLGDFILNSPTLNIFDGQFHHVAATYDGSLMVIYVDGQSVASRSANGAIQTTTTPLYLGAAIDASVVGATGRFFVGQLDEVDIFNRALTQTEIQSIFNAGSSGKCKPIPSQLLNISTRLNVQTGDNVLIGGFIVTGADPKKVIVRAIGPSLGMAGVSGALADPTLELHEPDGTVVTNDNWKDTQEAEIVATTIPPTNDLESAMVATLAPGAYTAIVSGKNGGTGVGLVETYDLDQAAASQLANISTRGFVETGDNVMIGGFIVGGGGGGNATVIVRAIGPSLGTAGVSGALADPTLELHDSNGAIIASNDNWKDTQEAEIEAAQLAPADDRESAIEATLAPGAYTAIVRGKDNGTGVGLVEAYNLQ